jgi:hypothetical protein
LRCHIEQTRTRRCTYESIVVRHPGEEVEHFIVGNGVRPDDFASELVDAPGHDEVAQRHQVQHKHGRGDHGNRQPRQVRHGEVESALKLFLFYC